MRTSDTLQTMLQSVSVTPVFVRPILSPQCPTSSKFRFAFSYTIFNIWNMTEYDKIMYMDGDLAVLRNMDHLVYEWATSGKTELRTPLSCDQISTDIRYNTGVWGVTPSQNTFQRLHEWITSGKYKKCGVGFQTAAFQFGARHTFYRMPIQFNLKADKRITKCVKRHKLPYIGVVHWSGNQKPIGRNTTDVMEKEALVMYQSMYEHVSAAFKSEK